MFEGRKDWATIALWISTCFSVVVAGWLLWGAGLFRSKGSFLTLAELASVGSFLSGVFTPLAIGWAARSFLLQRQQMIDSFGAMQQQLDMQRTQFERDRRLDIESSDPMFHIASSKVFRQGDQFGVNIFLLNQGAPARKIKFEYALTPVHGGDSIQGSLLIQQPMAKGDQQQIPISLPDQTGFTIGNYKVRFVILAERLDGAVSEYVLESIGTLAARCTSYRPAVQGLVLE